MRFASLLLALIALASPAFADDAATSSSVVVLRGTSAPPTPWYEPPPEPQVVIQPVYVPLYYYPLLFNGPTFHRHHRGLPARRNR
jgi:hypothetical protein